MKFNISADSFIQAVNCLIGILPSKPTHPILGNLCFIVTENCLTLKASNLKQWVKIELPLTEAVSGSFTVPGKLLNSILTSLHPEEDDRLFLELVQSVEGEEGQLLTIELTGHRYQFPGTEATEFPNIPAFTSETPLTINTSLLDLIQPLSIAVAVEETKQVLCGIHLSITNTELKAYATNGHVLGKMTTSLNSEQKEVDSKDAVQLTLPKEVIPVTQALANLTESQSLSLAVNEETHQLQIEGNNFQIVSSLLSGDYPQIDALVSNQFNHSLVVEKKSLISSLNRVSKFHQKKIVLFSFNFANKSLGITASSTLGKASEGIPISINSNDSTESKETSLEIGFNSEYFLSALKMLPTEEIVVQLNESIHPAVIKAMGGLDILGLIMPVQFPQLNQSSQKTEPTTTKEKSTTSKTRTTSRKRKAKAA